MLYLTAQSARVATFLLAAALAGCATPGATTKAPAASNGTRAMATPPVLPQPEGPVPLREPALVMRVWVAPWEGANGDLNAPGYVYTEIAPRRWTIGVQADPAAGRVITPLQIEERAAPAPQMPSAMPSAMPGEPGGRSGDAPQGFFSS